MKNKIIPLFLLILATTACKNTKPTPDDIEYDTEILDTKRSKNLSLEKVPCDFQFANPEQIDIISDSLLIVFDKAGNLRLAHLFNFEGENKGSTGMIGRGRGEMISPRGFSIGNDNHSIYFYDFATGFSIKFMVEDILKNKYQPKTIKLMDSLKLAIPRFSSVYNLTDRDLIGFGYDNNCRIISVNNNRTVDNYTDYPPVDENEEYTWSIWDNMAQRKISPNKQYIVNATRIGMMFEIFHLTPQYKLEKKVFKAFHQPEFGLAQGAKPACVTFNEKTFGGFSTLYCTDKSFFGVIDGPAPDYSHHNEIYEFDYSGELINKYKIDGEVACLAVSPEYEMYLIVTDKDGEQHLMKTDLKAAKE